MENIKFSIIIPAYNAEQYIQDSINSILNQTYSNHEIIVIDDCSTDNTYNVVKNNSNVKLLQTPINSRQGAARNIGLDNCSGDYILFLDADDILFDNFVLENLLAIIKEKKSPDIIYCGMKITEKRDLTIMPDENNTSKAFRLGQNKWMNVTSLCLRNSMIQKYSIRFPENIRYEDVYFAFIAIEKAATYAYTDFITYLYINRENTTTTTYTYAQSLDTIRMIEKLTELKDYISKENLPYLKQRIIEQTERLQERLKRVINYNFPD